MAPSGSGGPWGGCRPPMVTCPPPSMPPRYLHLLREPQRHPGAPSVHRGDVPKLQGTGQRGTPAPKRPVPIPPVWPSTGLWEGAHHADTLLFPPLPPRTASWSARTSTTMTVTSPTAPSAAAAARCSCAATTTAAGRCRGGPAGLGGPWRPPEAKGRGLPSVPWGAGPCRGASPWHTDVCAQPWRTVATWGWCRGSRGPHPPAPSL